MAQNSFHRLVRSGCGRLRDAKNQAKAVFSRLAWWVHSVYSGMMPLSAVWGCLAVERHGEGELPPSAAARESGMGNHKPRIEGIARAFHAAHIASAIRPAQAIRTRARK